MPREFYPDTIAQENVIDPYTICGVTTALFDGEGVCNRIKGHFTETMTDDNWGTGEFHQEAFEGWIWDGKGSIS